MRLIAITRVLNEADIIEAFVRHHATTVAHHILLDNGSIDGTLDILRALAAEPLPITVLQTNAVSYCEQSHWTALYDMAVRHFRADWVLCLDADEFVDDRALPLATHLATIPPDEHLLKVPMVVYHATSRDDPNQPIVPLRLTERVATVRAHKCIVRATTSKNLVIDDGAHDVLLDNQPLPAREAQGLRWAHYPERSPWQNLSKIAIGWCKVLAAGQQTVAAGVSHHYAGTFEWLTKDPGHIINNPAFWNFRHDTGNLTADPIDYKGGPLRHTPQTDPQLRMIRVLADYAEQLAKRHGHLIDRIPEARALTNTLNSQVKPLFGASK